MRPKATRLTFHCLNNVPFAVIFKTVHSEQLMKGPVDRFYFLPREMRVVAAPILFLNGPSAASPRLAQLPLWQDGP